jgi:hypothetical protein
MKAEKMTEGRKEPKGRAIEGGKLLKVENRRTNMGMKVERNK